MIALWAEQDVVLADEFRDGNVPAGTGNRRVLEAALAALPSGLERIVVRADSAAYEQGLLGWLEAAGHGYAISADMSRELAAAIRALPETAWRAEREDSDAVRHWAEVVYVPSGRRDEQAPAGAAALSGAAAQQEAGPAVRRRRRGQALRDRHQLARPRRGSGLDLIRWQLGKAGTVEHTHHVLTNELAAEALPSQKFGANAAWSRLNAMLYTLLSAFKRVALPPEQHDARPKRLRFVLLNGIGKVVRHARETAALRLVGEARRQLADAARLALALATGPPFVFGA